MDNKKGVLISIGILLFLVVVGFIWWAMAAFEAQPPAHIPDFSDITIEQQFEGKIVYGIYTEDMDENRLREHCAYLEGVFNECGTLCAPDAQACVQVCAYTCEFPSRNAPSVGFENDWTPYISRAQDFFIQYPQPVQVRQSDPSSVQFLYTGPTQTGNTELFDGFSVSITKMRKDRNESLDQFAQRQREALRPIASEISEIVDTQIADQQAKTFQATTLGIYRYIYVVSQSPEHVFELALYIADPGNRRYEEVVQRMLMSFQLVDESIVK